MKRLQTGLGLSESGVGARATQLPSIANLISFWDPTDTTRFNGGVAPSDGTQIQTWNDKISGVTLSQATVATRPIFKTSGLSGLPYVSMSGSQMLSASADSTLATAFGNGNSFTVMAFYRNCAGTAFGIIMQGKGAADYIGVGGSNYASNGAAYGVRTSISAYPFDGAVGSGNVQSIAQSFRGGVNNKADAMAVNGAVIAMPWSSPYAGSWPTTQDGTFSVGYLSNPSLSFKGELLGVLIWSKSLTPLEKLQAQKYFCERYEQPTPWATHGKLLVIPGDSQTYGAKCAVSGNIAGPVIDNWVAQIARSLSLPMGTWLNLGQSGQNTVDIGTWAVTAIDGIPAMAGVPTNLAYLEFYNLYLQGYTGGQAAAANLAFTAARKAAGFNKIALVSMIDDGGHWSGRAAYLSALSAGYLANGVSDLIPLDTQGAPGVSGVGQVGCAFAGTPTFDADLIHPIKLGHTDIKTFNQPYIAAW